MCPQTVVACQAGGSVVACSVRMLKQHSSNKILEYLDPNVSFHPIVILWQHKQTEWRMKRNLISVRCVERDTENCYTLRSICVSTQETVHLNVMYVRRNLPSAAFWRHICECTQERSHSSVKCAMQDLHNAATFGNILALTQARSHINAMFVVKNLQEIGNLNIILVFTAEWNHINVKYAINNFLMVVTSVDIPVSTEQ